MKKMFLVVIMVLGLVASAQAASINQSYQFGPNRVHLGAGQSGGQTWMNASIDTTLLVDSVYADLYPNWNDPSEFVWSFGVSGRRDLPATVQSMGGNMQYGSAGVWFSQSTYLDWSLWQNGSLHNYGGADMNLSPATFRYVSCYYNEWENSYGGGSGGGGGKGFNEPTIITEQWFGISATFHGSFGEGIAGDKLGQAYFGIVPEPMTAALLGFGGLFLRPRRRRIA